MAGPEHSQPSDASLSTTELTQSLLGVPYFVDPELQAIAMQAPHELPADVAAPRAPIHFGLLHLIVHERAREQNAARDAALYTGDASAALPEWIMRWNRQWTPTEE